MTHGARISKRFFRPLALAAASGAALGLLGGCVETDSFFDPTVVGRWEDTPTVMPILERLSAVEDEDTQYVQHSRVQPQDLIPEVEQYRFGPGDQIEVTIPDFPQIGQEGTFPRVIDAQGFVDLPRLPPVNLNGLSRAEAREAIGQAIIGAGIMRDPVVLITVQAQRTQTFSVIGAAQNPQQYFIPAPNYRLLDALTAAGGFNETVPYVIVIRQVPLSAEASGRPTPPPAAGSGEPAPMQPPANDQPAQPPQGDKIIDLIDELARPRGQDQPRPNEPVPAEPRPAQPSPQPGVLGELKNRRAQPPASERARSETPAPPPIDLPDSRGTPARTGGQPTPRSDWRYIDGKWVRMGAEAQAAQPTATTTDAQRRALVTQRVIEIATGPLLAGVADVNIVVRPGDVIRIPPPKTGLVYMTGQVVRVGPYSLPTDGRLTLQRAITAAGGLGSLAVAERVDITRMVGEGRQATMRVNLRAIFEQTQPDLYLKPDDQINVGTNFWMYPLAVIRGGFRASYGFGFILDRNFSGDVFGVDKSLSSGR